MVGHPFLVSVGNTNMDKRVRASTGIWGHVDENLLIPAPKFNWD
jgi:hypothetical protein